MSIRCIIGLGNPGEKQVATRHNLGYMIVDELCRRHNCGLKPGRGKFYLGWAKVKQGEKFLLVKPTTYMNRSGIAVEQIMEKEKLTPRELLVIVDDFDLPFGRLRLRQSGSAGSHNGLESIIFHIESENFPRLRIGIGNPPQGMEPASFVLSEFGKKEKDELNDIITRAADAVEIAVDKDIEKAMNIFNRKRIED